MGALDWHAFFSLTGLCYVPGLVLGPGDPQRIRHTQSLPSWCFLMGGRGPMLNGESEKHMCTTKLWPELGEPIGATTRPSPPQEGWGQDGERHQVAGVAARGVNQVMGCGVWESHWFVWIFLLSGKSRPHQDGLASCSLRAPFDPQPVFEDSFIGAWLHSFMHVLPVTDFVLPWPSWIVETKRTTGKSKDIYCRAFSRKKFADFCSGTFFLFLSCSFFISCTHPGSEAVS